MKKVLVSLLLCSSLSMCFAKDKVDNSIPRLVTIAVEVAQDAEVQKAAVQLHQAYLNFLEVVLQKIANTFDAEEKALAQVALNHLVALANDPLVRSLVAPEDALVRMNDEEMQQLQEKIAPIIAAIQIYGPELQKAAQENIMITKAATSAGGGTCSVQQPRPECVNFMLDRVIEALEIAQKSVQEACA